MSVRTIDEKTAAIRARKEAERALGAQIDRAMRTVDLNDQPNQGCLAGIWAWLGRLRKGRGPYAAGQAVEMAAANSSSAFGKMSTGSRVTHATLFGLGAKADPHAKLAEAARSMELRIEQLEQRAAECRAEAKRLMTAGQKPAAMRALKKAKAVEKQLEANQASLLAVEQQVDMMAQAAMQKTVASALKTSTKGMKADKKLLKNAEAAVDDAQEARDMADDLSAVMADFAQNGGPQDVDEDDLMAELEEMVGTEPPPPAHSQAEIRAAAADAAAALEAKHAQWEAAEAIRSAMPVAPTGKLPKGEEKQGLLAM